MKLILILSCIFGLLLNYVRTQDINNNPCLIEPQTVYHSHPTDQKKFIQCADGGRMFILSCPDDLIWDNVNTRCRFDDSSSKPSLTNIMSNKVLSQNEGIKISKNNINSGKTTTNQWDLPPVQPTNDAKLNVNQPVSNQWNLQPVQTLNDANLQNTNQWNLKSDQSVTNVKQSSNLPVSSPWGINTQQPLDKPKPIGRVIQGQSVTESVPVTKDEDNEILHFISAVSRNQKQTLNQNPSNQPPLSTQDNQNQFTRDQRPRIASIVSRNSIPQTSNQQQTFVVPQQPQLIPKLSTNNQGTPFLPNNIQGASIQVPNRMPTQDTTDSRINTFSSNTDSMFCNRVEITGSSLPLVNGGFSQISTTKSGMFPMYRRNGNPIRPGIIVAFSNKWCLTLSFSLFSEDSTTPSLIEQNCKDFLCCLLLSDITDNQDITDQRRVWFINALNQKGKIDENINVRCADGNTVSVPVLTPIRTVQPVPLPNIQPIQTVSMQTAPLLVQPISSTLPVSQVTGRLSTGRQIISPSAAFAALPIISIDQLNSLDEKSLTAFKTLIETLLQQKKISVQQPTIIETLQNPLATSLTSNSQLLENLPPSFVNPIPSSVDTTQIIQPTNLVQTNQQPLQLNSQFIGPTSVNTERKIITRMDQTANSLVPFIPVNDCSLITCPTDFTCVTKQNKCSNCNPGCNPNGNMIHDNVIPITCANVLCPANTHCALDKKDNLIKCIIL